MLLPVDLILLLITLFGSLPFSKGCTRSGKKFIEKNPLLKVETVGDFPKAVRILPRPFYEAIPFAKSREEKIISGEPIPIDDKPDRPRRKFNLKNLFKKVINTVDETQAEKLLVEKLQITKNDMRRKERVFLYPNSDPMCNVYERDRQKYCDMAKEIVADFQFVFEQSQVAPYGCTNNPRQLKSAPMVIANVQVVMCPENMMIASGIEHNCYFYFSMDNNPAIETLEFFRSMRILGHWCKDGTSDDVQPENENRADGDESSDVEIIGVIPAAKPMPILSKERRRTPNFGNYSAPNELIASPSSEAGPSRLNEVGKPILPPVKVKREQPDEEETGRRKKEGRKEGRENKKVENKKKEESKMKGENKMKRESKTSKTKSKQVQQDSKENVRRIPNPNLSPPAPITDTVASPDTVSFAPLTTAPVADPTTVPFATRTAVPPAACATIPAAAPTTLPFVTRTAVPPAASAARSTIPVADPTTLPFATRTAVLPAASAARATIPVADPTTLPFATRTAVPPAARATIPAAAPTTLPFATRTAVPPAASAARSTIPVADPTTLPFATRTAVPPAASAARATVPAAVMNFGQFPARFPATAGPIADLNIALSQTKSDSKSTSITRKRTSFGRPRGPIKDKDESSRHTDSRNNNTSHSGHKLESRNKDTNLDWDQYESRNKDTNLSWDKYASRIKDTNLSWDKYESRNPEENRLNEGSSYRNEKALDMRGVQISLAKVKQEKSDSPSSLYIGGSQRDALKENDFLKISQEVQYSQEGESGGTFSQKVQSSQEGESDGTFSQKAQSSQEGESGGASMRSDQKKQISDESSFEIMGDDSSSDPSWM